MKRKNIIAFSVALMAIGAFTSCSDEFLQDKKNYDYVDASTYNTFSGAKARVDDIYAWCLPNTSSDPSWKYNSTGAADLQSKSTEEYSGFGSFVDPDAPMTSQSGNNTVPDYFHNSGNNIQASVWGRIRNCNDVIYGIENSTLSDEEKNELLGSKDTSPEDYLPLPSILADMVLHWVGVTRMTSVCLNVKCVKFTWFRSVMLSETMTVSL